MLDHRGRGELHRQERRAHVDREVVIESLGIGVGDRAGGRSRAGVADHAVDAAEALDRLGDELLDVVFARHVSGDEERTIAE